MKPIFFVLLMMISFFAQTSQAAEPELATSVARAFETSFNDAENVQWSQAGSLMKVTFTLDEKNMFAFYNAQAELVVTGKYMTVKQLPKMVQNRLADAAKGYKITEVFEIDNEQDSKYYATLVNSTEEKIIVSSGGKWSTFKKTVNRHCIDWNRMVPARPGLFVPATINRQQQVDCPHQLCAVCTGL